MVNSFRKALDDEAFTRNFAPLTLGGDVKKNPYGKSQIVYSCISRTARAIAQVPMVVANIKGDDPGTWERIKGPNPWSTLLNRPNYLMTGYLFREALYSYLLLDGNVFIIPFPPIYKEYPKALYIVRKNYMEPIYSENKATLIGWNYKPSPNVSFPLRIDEVCHIKFFHPTDPVFGQAPLEAGELPVLADYKASKYNNLFFDNGAILSGVLSTDKALSPTQRKAIRDEFENRHQGLDRAHKLAVLEGGLKYQATGVSMQDMQFLELRKFTRDEILQIFGMKKTILSITDTLNYAITRGERRDWWVDTNLPLMALTLSSMNYSFFPDAGYGGEIGIVHDISKVEALQEQFREKIDAAVKLAQLGFTPNEINVALNLGFTKKWWRDYWWQPLNLSPIGGKKLSPEELKPPENPPAEPPKEDKPPEKNVRLIPERIPKEIERESFKRKRTPERQALLEKNWKAYIATLDPIEAKYKGHLRRIFYAMRTKTLAALRKSDEKEAMNRNAIQKDVDDVYDLDFAEEADLIRKYSDMAYRSSVSAGIAAVAGETGIDVNWTMNDPAVLEFLNVRPVRIRWGTNVIAEELRGICQSGIEEGLTVNQIGDMISQYYNELSGYRANAIARTEIGGSAGFGRYVGLRNTGIRYKEWFTALDEKVRSTHMAMEGMVVLMEEMWNVGGELLKYPGDVDGSGEETINCRCSEVAVYDENGEEQGDEIIPEE
jgi:HK97 family phage portal protein